MGEFSYYKRPEGCIRDFKNAYRFLKNKKILVDLKYLEVIEAGELGFCTAWIELQESFSYGINGFPKNYKLARYYTNKILAFSLEKDILSLKRIRYDALKADAYLEYNFQNYQKAKKKFIKAAKFMVEKIPTQEWNFQIFEIIQMIDAGEFSTH